MLRNLGLVLLSTLISLLMVEFAARLELIPLPDHVSTDAWWAERWQRERKGMNPRAIIELDADLGYVPAANLDLFEYQDARISTNAKHMRGRQEYALERSNSARIVAIGDSFTFGQCANDDETFPFALEQSLIDAEVLNLGVMGYGQDQAFLRLRRDGFPYRPDVVVFGFHSTDMRRNLLSFRGYGKPRLRFEDGRVEVENVPVPSPEEYSRWWPPRIWNFVEIFRASREDRKVVKRRINEVSLAIVHQMAIETREQGALFAVVHLPHPRSLGGEGEHGWKFMEKVCAEATAAGGICIEPVPRFREIASTPEEVNHHFACHFSPELYQALGEVIAEALVRARPDRFALRN
ncbi:MAG: hypothetical protein JRH01_03785 [Deltaproteobacteria bacterium]|nr:hypothetical protein [Deltaproteobacteria bacterium]MBW2394272.1 hypothetical protein [Deltaproteobacteria bacterium]